MCQNDPKVSMMENFKENETVLVIDISNYKWGLLNEFLMV